MKKVTIIGAGIGGLTAAIALKQKGFKVEIFEHTAEFKKVGSGINLAINAMVIYKQLGIYDAILNQGNYTRSINIRTRNLGFLSQVNFENIEKQYDVKTVAIHRAKLHQILLDQLGDIDLHLDKKLKTLIQANGKVELKFKDGTTHTSELVIGADGIHSTVRKSIFNDTQLRDAHQVCWRGISTAQIDSKHREELNEIWGKGNRFGFVSISKSETYWFALINKHNFKSKEVNLINVFSDYHQTVKDIISETHPEHISCTEISDLKPIDYWYKGNVCLIGDAAHATTPNMGQGAVQAIESAMAISTCLLEESDNEQAFRRYQIIRKEKADYIVKTSWRIGKLAQIDHILIRGIRNFIMKLTPKFIIIRQNKKLFNVNL